MKKFLAFLIAALIPIAAIVLGVLAIFANTMPTISFFITFVILPAFCISLLALIIFKLRNVFLKILATAVVLVLFVAFWFKSYLLGYFEIFRKFDNEKTATSYYTQFCESYSTLPTLNELGNYSEVEYYCYSSQSGIFTCDAFTLIVHYNAENYENEKEILNENYFFQYGEMIGYNNQNCLPTAQIEDYNFRALDTTGEHYPENEIEHPKKLVIISTNDVDKTISYTAFYNNDLDYILSLEELLLKNCGWKYIVKQKD